MTADKRRVLRMMCKAMLLVSLPLAGFAWALPETTTMMLGAGALTLLSLAVGFGAEVLASATESDIYELREQMSADGKRRAAELEARDEKLRQFDRIVGLLSDQNHSLRAKLITVQIDLQRKKEALVDAAEEAIGLDDAIGSLSTNYSARAH
jgi:septal ring factor EnvC (AmiA/AmiB activator)